MGEAWKRTWQNLTWGHNIQFKIGATVLVCIGRLPMLAHQPIGFWIAKLDTTGRWTRPKYTPKLFVWQYHLSFGGKTPAVILTPLSSSELKEYGCTEYSGPPGHPGSFGEAP